MPHDNIELHGVPVMLGADNLTANVSYLRMICLPETGASTILLDQVPCKQVNHSPPRLDLHVTNPWRGVTIDFNFSYQLGPTSYSLQVLGCTQLNTEPGQAAKIRRKKRIKNKRQNTKYTRPYIVHNVAVGYSIEWR